MYSGSQHNETAFSIVPCCTRERKASTTSCHNARSLNQVEDNRMEAMIQCPHYPVNFVQVGYFIQAIVGTMHVHWQSLQVREFSIGGSTVYNASTADTVCENVVAMCTNW